MSVGVQSARVAYRFANFEFHPELPELCKFGFRLKLERKPLLLLDALLQRPGEVIGREELQAKLWPGNTFVDFELGLNVAVKKLRDALGDSAESPRFVETLVGRGYRFIAAVECSAVEPQMVPAAAAASTASMAIEPLAEARPPDHKNTNERIRPAAWAGMIAAMVLIAAIAAWVHLGRSAPVSFSKHEFVLVTRFENRTGERQLNDVVGYAVERELDNSLYVSVVSPERITDTLRLMEKSSETPIDHGTGREICLRDGGIKLLIAGEVKRIGGKYVIAADIIDPDRDARISSVTEEASSTDDLQAAARRLANQLREKLGESLASVQQSARQLEKVTTPSLRAFQLYSEARRLLARNQDAAALVLVRQALDADPEFASAHLQLARLTNDYEERMQHARRAFELSDRTSDRERYFIQGRYYIFVGESSKAIASLEILAGLYPDHQEGIYALAHLYPVVGREGDAVELLIRHIAQRPNDFSTIAEAAQAALTWGGDLETAGKLVARARPLFTPEESGRHGWYAPFMELFEAHSAWVSGDIDRTVGEIDRIAKTLPDRDQGDRTMFAIYTGLWYLTLGKVSSAEAAFQLIDAPDERASWFALAAYARGDMHTFRRQTERYLRLKGNHHPTVLLTDLIIRTGALNAADAEVALRFKQHREDETQPSLMGELALARGNLTSATPLLEQGTRVLQREGTAAYFMAAESLASIYERTGELLKAKGTLEAASKGKVRTFVIPRPCAYFWLRDRLALARLDRKLGRTADAERIESELAHLLKFADPDFTLLQQLKDQAAVN